jgi:hypothetical protein
LERRERFAQVVTGTAPPVSFSMATASGMDGPHFPETMRLIWDGFASTARARSARVRLLRLRYRPSALGVVIPRTVVLLSTEVN